MRVRRLAAGDRDWVRAVLTEHFASPRIVSRGNIHQADQLDGYLAERANGPLGLVLFEIGGAECEVIVLLSIHERQGVGTALLGETTRAARAAGCRRLWLVTTNDNLRAIEFYRRRGWRLVAVRRGAVAKARRLKPEIPACGPTGLQKVDEVEFELALEVVD